jgi:glycosyltransferase involved in cell wall biosynthesis
MNIAKNNPASFEPSDGSEVLPTVSVAMITYNHEKFIAQAIESVLMQKTTFPIELVIGEDCSTDGTRRIVEEYARKFPRVIRVGLRQGNVGPSKNGMATLGACRGKYVATLEGDDYWTDPNKLEKQVGFLEANPECIMCFHDALIISDKAATDGSDPSAFYSEVKPKSRVSFADHAAGFVPPTCSCMFGNDRASLEPVLTGELLCFATSIFYCLMSSGRLSGFIPERMAAYRMHPGGIWSPLSAQAKQQLAIRVAKTTYLYFKATDSDKAELFEPRLFNLHLWLALYQLKAGSVCDAFKSYSASWLYAFSSFSFTRVRRFSLAHLRCLGHFVRQVLRAVSPPSRDTV